jgi:hypothetical protein
MLQKLGDHIAECLERAAKAEHRAATSDDPAIKADFQNMAKTWRELARHYQFAEALERFLLDKERGKDAFLGKQPPAPT